MQNIDKIDEELGASAIMHQWNNQNDIIEPMREFFDKEPLGNGDKASEAKPIDKASSVKPPLDNQPLAGSDSFRIDAGDKEFSSLHQVEESQDKNPYQEIDKDDGTGNVTASD